MCSMSAGAVTGISGAQTVGDLVGGRWGCLGHLRIIWKGLRHSFDTMHFIHLYKSIIDSRVNKLYI